MHIGYFSCARYSHRVRGNAARRDSGCFHITVGHACARRHLNTGRRIYSAGSQPIGNPCPNRYA